MDRDMYLTNKEACWLLCVSRATFYRTYYPLLIEDPKTLIRNGRLFYYRPSLQALFRPVTEQDQFLESRRRQAAQASRSRKSIRRSG
jgi:hypothetical protein